MPAGKSTKYNDTWSDGNAAATSADSAYSSPPPYDFAMHSGSTGDKLRRSTGVTDSGTQTETRESLASSPRQNAQKERSPRNHFVIPTTHYRNSCEITFQMSYYDQSKDSINLYPDLIESPIEVTRALRGRAVRACPNLIAVEVLDGDSVTLPSGQKSTMMIMFLPDSQGVSTTYKMSSRAAWPSLSEEEKKLLTSRWRTSPASSASATPQSERSFKSVFFVEQAQQSKNMDRLWRLLGKNRQSKVGEKKGQEPPSTKCDAYETREARFELDDRVRSMLARQDGNRTFDVEVFWDRLPPDSYCPPSKVSVKVVGDVFDVINKTGCHMSHLIVKPNPKTRYLRDEFPLPRVVTETVHLSYYQDTDQA